MAAHTDRGSQWQHYHPQLRRRQSDQRRHSTPTGRTTTFTYNAQSQNRFRSTDPRGARYDVSVRFHGTQTDTDHGSQRELRFKYSYNSLYQLTNKTDKAGRTFTYSYSANEPTAVDDSASTSPLGSAVESLGNWATNQTALAANVTRTYTPATTTSHVDGRGKHMAVPVRAIPTAIWSRRPHPTGQRGHGTYTYDPATLMLLLRRPTPTATPQATFTIRKGTGSRLPTRSDTAVVATLVPPSRRIPTSRRST